MDHSQLFPVSRMCQILGVSRSGYYDWLKAPESERALENAKLLDQIKTIHKNSRSCYGSPKITSELLKQGQKYGHNRIARIMRDNGIRAKVVKGYRPKTKVIDANEASANLLDRRFAWDRPNMAWATDITYIPTKTGWVYLCVFLDLCSRSVVGWSVSNSMKTEFVLEALDNACQKRNPGNDLIVHSDQGVQFGSSDFRTYLKKKNFIQSMSRRGNCWDNACVESFFRLIKVEELNSHHFNDIDEVRYRIFVYIEYFYNRNRSHSRLGYMSPADYERRFIA